jgi:hypothetical protein
MVNITTFLYSVRAVTSGVLVLIVGVLIGMATTPPVSVLAFTFFVPFFSLITVFDIISIPALGFMSHVLNSIFALVAFSLLAPKFQTLKCSAEVCMSASLGATPRMFC